MSVRHVLAVGAGTVLGGFGLAEPGAARASVEPLAADACDLTAGRLVGTSTALVALVGVVVGVVNPAVADGGPGTGNGVPGGALAVFFGVVATVLGRLALVRSRRTGPTGPTGRPADRPDDERAFA
ncbi:DUF6223 family protein [Streptomyces sp. NPDC085529]|uniref:DUF6223 family protein n=1 Tax=Streptomyces sp. NPDC085529 TaxID=3365729 RepID=UPI0037D19FD6